MRRPVYGLGSRRPLTLDELDSERASDWRLGRLWVQHGHSLGRFLPSWRLTPLTCKQIPPFLHHRLLRGAEERAEATSLWDRNPGTTRFLHQGGREMPEKAGGWLGQGLRDGWAAAALPPSPLPSQCNQGYPSPSLGWWQPSLQRHHCQLLRSSSFWRERSRGAREREGEPKGTCPTNSKGSSPTPAPASPQRRLGPLAQAAGQALLLGAPSGGFRR